MRNTIAMLALLLALCAAAAHAAEPKVGKLDGKPGPTLPAVATPVTVSATAVQAEPLLNPSDFPTMLEKQGEPRFALLEWLRIANREHGDERADALVQAARLQVLLGDAEGVSHTVATYMQENPSATAIPQMLAYKAETAAPAEQAQTLKTLRQTYPDAPQTQQALVASIWRQARAGHVTETYGLPLGKQLQQRINGLYNHGELVAKGAAAFAVVPGLGFMALGNVSQGALMLTLWALCMLAFMSACRHRHYAYAFVFAFPAMALWLNSPLATMQLARQYTQASIQQTVTQWQVHYQKRDS